MRKILKIFFLNLLIANSTFAETKEQEKAKYVLLNMHQDYITCYSFYKIGAEYVRKSNSNNKIINGIEKSSNTSLRHVYETAELMGMQTQEMSSKIKPEMENQLNLIDNNFNNASVLLEKYAQTCKNLIENKKQRISFLEKKATEKFNE